VGLIKPSPKGVLLMANLKFWEKYDGIAQSKGYDNVEEMMYAFKEKHTNSEIAEILGISLRTVEMIWVRMVAGRGVLPKDRTNKKLNIHKDGEGFNKTDVKQRWMKLLGEKGFSGLKDAADHYKNNGLTVDRMAADLGVTLKSLIKRLEAAGIILPKEEAIRKELNPLGLLDD
jgi:hypothetical protein